MSDPLLGGPWTRHGHAILGITVEGLGRPPLARCGGPGLCPECARDAATIRAERVADQRDRAGHALRLAAQEYREAAKLVDLASDEWDEIASQPCTFEMLKRLDLLDLWVKYAQNAREMARHRLTLAALEI